jgi:hypothetical protein
MKLYIPACGDRITLSEPWTFTLYLEHRNKEFGKIHNLIPKDAHLWSSYYGPNLESREITLSAGTILECDRVYIRTFNKSRIKSNDDYDSITWRVIKPNGKAAPKQRFWAKLHDCNSIYYDSTTVQLYRDRVKLFKVIHEA